MAIDEHNCKEAREIYLQFMREFPRKHDFILGNRNLWWFLGMSEKNIWADKFIHRLCHRLRFNHAFEEEKTGAGLTMAILPFKYYLRAVVEAFKTLLKIVILKAHGVKRVSAPVSGAVGFFGFYPAWFKKPYSDRPVDLFFDAVPEKLKEDENVHRLLWIEPWRALLTGRKKLFAFLKADNNTVLERLLSIDDILSLFDPGVFWRLYSVLRAVRGTYSDFARDELQRSMTSPNFFQARLLDRAVSRFHPEKMKALLFRLEFQPLERALLYNAGGKTPTIGFQHSALSRNFLNYQFMDGELKTTDMPLPDFIFTSGEIGKRTFSLAGYPADRINICGGVRFKVLYDYMRNQPAKETLRGKYRLPPDKKIVLVATMPLPEETLAMLTDLNKAIADDRDVYYIIVKCHPNATGQVKKLQGSIKAELVADALPLYDYITLSDAVILSGGSLSIEAMFLGATPIIYACPGQFSHNPLSEYPDAALLSHDAGSMKRALKIAFEQRTDPAMKDRRQRIVNDQFDFSEDPAAKFIKCLKRLSL